MKIFVIGKKTFITSVLCVMLIVSALFAGQVNSVPASVSTDKELPIYSVETPDKKVAITFDAAWNDNDIDDIIKILAHYNCPATFFVVGDWADKYPDAVRKLYSAGHEIANHSDSHNHFSSLTAHQMKEDMDKCDKKIAALTGTTPLLFRAPYGEYNNTLISVCRETGRHCIQWDIDSLDWKGLTAAQMTDKVVPKLQNGSIILFHNGTENTASALPDILDKIKKEGYSFTTVGNLIYRENYAINHAGRQIPQ